jgi:signal transduction histidine kinase
MATNVNRLIENVLALAHKQLEHSDIAVETHLPADLPEIVGVPDQLTQVFMNLIVNALEAMPQGGKLFITTLADDRGISIVMEDNGVGISSDDTAKIFEPFYTTKPAGTGLGLAVSYGIIQQHGGRIDVASIPDEGTAFTIWLPFDHAPSGA